MRAIMVCVDYADLLALTLPYNRHHFDEVLIVTTPHDVDTYQVARANDARVFLSNAFYEDGAVFNKWKALEQGLDAFGRTGWLCLMDADVLWPKQVSLNCQHNTLYTPRRRMHEHFVGYDIPPESEWNLYPLHPQQREFAGYSQIFHSSDVHLGSAPWHHINWAHAGGADSFFQGKWPEAYKRRPDFEVLHLGPAGVNWCGRSSVMTDGTVPPQALERKQQLRQFIKSRKRGATDPYAGEKIR